MIKCEICGKLFVGGKRSNGIPNGVGFELEDGTIISVSSDCILRGTKGNDRETIKTN